MPKPTKNPEPVEADPYYMVQRGSVLSFYKFDAEQLRYVQLNEVDLGRDATPVFNAALKKKLRFFIK